jgi:tellurite resistance protein TerC
VSDNTFIIYSSNAFAILGLRALYFLLAGMLKKFHYLGKGLAFILAFIGVKLFLQAGHKVISTDIPEIPSLVSLGVIVVALTVSIVMSLLRPLPESESDSAELDTAESVTADDANAAVDGSPDTGELAVMGASTEPAGPTSRDPARVQPPAAT